MVQTRQWQLAHKPRDEPQLSGPNPTWKLESVDLPALKDDELLVKTICLSNDPAQRGWIGKSIRCPKMLCALAHLSSQTQTLLRRDYMSHQSQLGLQ